MCGLLIRPESAFSHVTLAEPAALANTAYKAALQVGHGCDGSPTTAITVQLPAGFRGAKPMVHAGWVAATREEKLAAPYPRHGKTVTHDVVEVTWTASAKGYWLADAHFDEFTVRGTLADTPGPMWFKVLQTCETGRNGWMEIPASGISTHGLKTPAALLEVLPSGPASTSASAHQH